MIVAEADGVVTGWASLNRFNPRPAYDHVADFSIYIERGWRGRGVGSALMRAAISRAREQGLHKLSLEVFAHNAAAIALYRACGFTEEGRRIRQYRRSSGELWDSVIMGLALEGPGSLPGAP